VIVASARARAGATLILLNRCHNTAITSSAVVHYRAESCDNDSGFPMNLPPSHATHEQILEVMTSSQPGCPHPIRNARAIGGPTQNDCGVNPYTKQYIAHTQKCVKLHCYGRLSDTL
jgi:hypothetical protein